jgi:hypothetical protein
VARGERYLDALLEEVRGETERSLWNDLNQREREIAPLLVKGVALKPVVARGYIGEPWQGFLSSCTAEGLLTMS